MKRALETRKTNVESINKLLTEFKAEGELTSGHFPQDVGEKIARLNIDWQVIIRLAIALKERPISEEMVIPEFMQIAESGNMNDMFTTHEQFKVNGRVYCEFCLKTKCIDIFLAFFFCNKEENLLEDHSFQIRVELHLFGKEYA